jgi:nicotinamidase-related amidase
MKRLILVVMLAALSSALFSQDKKGVEPAKLEMKAALVVIDIQNEFLKYMSPDKDKALEMINWAVAVARKYQIPVIRVYHTDPDWGPKPGTEEFEFPKSIQVSENDPKVIKNFPDGFKKTDLDKVLKEKGINSLFLCGLSATGCVLATYHGAADLDYHAFMLQGAIMSDDYELTKAVEKICPSVSVETFNFMVKYLPR